MSNPSYPLAWPLTFPRAKSRERGQFQVTFAKARNHLLKELELLGAIDVVLSSNVPVRVSDGLPYARGSGGQHEDPGVAIYWTVRDAADRPQLFVMACDRYLHPVANIRALGLTVAALRTVERHGTKQLRDRAFSGFTALPANAGGQQGAIRGRTAPPAPPWRKVFGFLPDAKVSRALLEAVYRQLASIAHPDHGGSHEEMAKLNAARADALREII